MDVDHRTLSKAGFWAVGRLQTDADRERVVDSLANANEPGSTAAELSALIRKLGPAGSSSAASTPPATPSCSSPAGPSPTSAPP